MEECLAVILVHGPGASDRAEALRARYSANRAVTTVDNVQNGDLVLLEDLEGLEWIASNVLLLPGNRAPIVRLLTLDEALAELAS